MGDFVLFQPEYESDSAFFRKVDPWDRATLLARGFSLTDESDPTPTYYMDEEPGRTGMGDYLRVLNRDMLVSKRMRDFFEQEGVKNLEFLPARVLNQKGRMVEDAFFVIKVPKFIDFIDQENTKFEWNLLNKKKMMNINSLHINEYLIPSDVVVSQASTAKFVTVIRRSFAQKMVAAGVDKFSTDEVINFFGL